MSGDNVHARSRFQFEMLVHGKFACDEVQNVCLGKEPRLDGMVQLAIATQRAADRPGRRLQKRCFNVCNRREAPIAPAGDA